MTTLDGINKAMDWYHANHGSNDIEGFARCQNQLSSYFYRLAQELAEAKQDYLQCKFNRRRAVMERKHELLKNPSGSISVARAELLAEYHALELIERETDAEMVYEGYKAISESIRETLGSMKQYISYLKEELNHTRRGTGQNG